MSASPDRTIYHQTPSIRFARTLDGAADLLLILKSGAPQFAIPLHLQGRFSFTTGYSGILFPDTSSESTLGGAVESLHALFRSNPHVGFHCVQAVPAPAYDNRERAALLDYLLGDEGMEKRETFSRVLRMPENADPVSEVASMRGDLDPVRLENDLLPHYDPDLRNQIRQAIRRNLKVQYFVLRQNTDADATRSAYELYTPIHKESWRRTGMVPHPLQFWTAFSKAIQDSGGIDLVVVTASPDGRPIAGVTCHLYAGRALYWSGCSLTEGLQNRANPLTLHAAITLCRSLGIQLFELGRMDTSDVSAKERSVNQYKAQFRGSLIRVINFRREPHGIPYHAFMAASRVKRSLLNILSVRMKKSRSGEAAKTGMSDGT